MCIRDSFKPYREVILFLFSIPSPGGQSGFTSEPAKTIGAGTPPDFCCEKVCVRRSYRALRDKSRPFDRLDALLDAPHPETGATREREPPGEDGTHDATGPAFGPLCEVR